MGLLGAAPLALSGLAVNAAHLLKKEWSPPVYDGREIYRREAILSAVKARDIVGVYRLGLKLQHKYETFRLNRYSLFPSGSDIPVEAQSLLKERYQSQTLFDELQAVIAGPRIRCPFDIVGLSLDQKTYQELIILMSVSSDVFLLPELEGYNGRYHLWYPFTYSFDLDLLGRFQLTYAELITCRTQDIDNVLSKDYWAGTKSWGSCQRHGGNINYFNNRWRPILFQDLDSDDLEAVDWTGFTLWPKARLIC